MSGYEVTHPGGSVEHYNDEAGATWMKRLTDTYLRDPHVTGYQLPASTSQETAQQEP